MINNFDATKTYDILTSNKLTYNQKLNQLATQAENGLKVLNIDDKFKMYQSKGALCDMNEGNAPYRPRYVMVDFEKFMGQGSLFLGISKPTTLDEAIFALLTLYYHIPSITTMPVYLGDLDKLLNPFMDGLTDDEIKSKIKLFLNYIDRTIADGYCHANLGPESLRATELILESLGELKNAVPNFSFKYDIESTPNSIMEKAIVCAMKCSNPAFTNHNMNKDTYDDYGVSSCYNILPLGGGAHILSRVVVPRLAKLALDTEDFLDNVLPDALFSLAKYMDERIRFLVEESGFYDSSFLVKEQLVDKDNFVGMFGVAGLCDGVNYLLRDSDKKYGRDKEADDLAQKILSRINDFVQSYECKYSKKANNRYLMHAQAGLSTDEGVTSGVRIKVGDEPLSIYEHLIHSSKMHKFFQTGCSDIFPFEKTAKKNPASILDIIKGAFSMGDRYIAIYQSDSDLVRITGYLVKRSEIEKYDSGEVVLHDTVVNGSTNYKLNRLKDRKVRTNENRTDK